MKLIYVIVNELGYVRDGFYFHPLTKRNTPLLTEDVNLAISFPSFEEAWEHIENRHFLNGIFEIKPLIIKENT